MTGLDKVRESMAEFLNAHGVEAVTAWEETERKRRTGAVAAVSLRKCEGGPSGFRDYLGERWDAERAAWQELYGRRMRLTFALDLYAPRGADGGDSALRRGFDALADALREGGPEGMRVLEFSCGETEFWQETGLYRCLVEAVCEVYLYAVADAGGAFLDFELRGERMDR